MSGPGNAWLSAEVDDLTRLVPTPVGRVFVVEAVPRRPVTRGPIVLLHGLFVTHHVFHRLIPRLATDRRVIALDLPGTGDSDHPPCSRVDDYSWDGLAGAVLATLDAVGVESFDLLGHDYGGAVALAMAIGAPDRVRTLLLCDPLALGVSLPLAGSLAVTPALGPEVFRRALRRADVRAFVAQGMSTPELVSDSKVNVYWDRLGRPGAREATHAMLGQVAHLVRMRERFASLRAPTSLVWGDRDRIVSPEQGERLLALLPNATLAVVEGCGHSPAEERPEELARIVEQHTG